MTTVGGRPPGIAAYSEDVIVVAVALQGLVTVDTASGATWYSLTD